jgi:hypothetical protein
MLIFLGEQAVKAVSAVFVCVCHTQRHRKKRQIRRVHDIDSCFPSLQATLAKAGYGIQAKQKRPRTGTRAGLGFSLRYGDRDKEQIERRKIAKTR